MKVAGGGPEQDGIVVDTPSATKVVVAVVDAGRGPVLRTVHVKTLSERAEEGSDDRALRLLLRRTAPAHRGGARGGPSAVRGHAAHTRGAAHRPTGK